MGAGLSGEVVWDCGCCMTTARSMDGETLIPASFAVLHLQREVVY